MIRMGASSKPAFIRSRGQGRERKRGEGAWRCHKISILNFCSYVLRVIGKESLQQRGREGIVLGPYVRGNVCESLHFSKHLSN